MAAQPHPPKTKTAVLDGIRAGTSYRALSDQHGVALGTISKWADEAGIEVAGAEQVAAAAEKNRLTWLERRGTLVDEMGSVAAEMLQRVRDAGEARASKDYAVTVAVLVEKAQLLSGGVTSRHEQLDAARREERVKSMRDELAERRATQKDGTTGS